MSLVEKQTFVAPKRSNYSLDNIVVGDSDFGFVKPVRVIEALGGCSYKINLGSQIETAPTKFSVYGSLRSNYRAFFFPRRLLATVDSAGTIGRVPAVFNPEGATADDAVSYLKLLPYTVVNDNDVNVPDPDDFYLKGAVVSRNSLLETLGFPYGFDLTRYQTPDGENVFPDFLAYPNVTSEDIRSYIYLSPYSAASLVAYWDMIYNYYSNHHFGYVPMRICYDVGAGIGVPSYSYYYIDLNVLSNWLVAIKTGRAAAVTCDFRLFGSDGRYLREYDLIPQRFLVGTAGGKFYPFVWSPLSIGEDSAPEWADSVGLSLCTFSPDINTAWISDEEYATWLSRAKITVQNNSISYEDIISASSFYKEAAKFAFGDGTFEDFFAAVNGVRAQPAATCCQYLGGFSRRIDFQSVRQTAATSDGALGDVGGYAATAMAGHICNFYTREPGYIIITHTIVPDLVYSRGIESYLLRTRTEDFYSPNFANIGYQPRRLVEVDAVSHPIPGAPFNRAVGYQPAWTEYTTATSRAVGSMNYAGNKRGWTFQAPPYMDGTVGQAMGIVRNVYCHPQDFQNIFVLNSPLSHNFYCQYGFNVKSRQIIPKRNMPKLSL